MIGRFENGRRMAEAEGFYDGDGCYRIRFMPDEEGVWTYVTESGCAELDGIEGRFVCAKPSPGNHGPVRVKDAARFQYADGSGFVPIGTTCYAWHRQSAGRQERTLRTLAGSPFNKVRMHVLPGAGDAAEGTGQMPYPFAGTPEAGFDCRRLQPDYFAHLERKVGELMQLGIEAELILFRPDGPVGIPGTGTMSPEDDELYLRYVVARLGAYRNIWWSLADEYDAINRRPADWARLFRILQECDCGAHLRSIRNREDWYDFGVPWVTHASIRHEEVRVASDATKQYEKPAVIDDCGSEGNLDDRWSSLTAEEMLCRIWEGHCRGGYVTHSETLLSAEGTVWRWQGGELLGDCASRIAFMRGILEDAPGHVAYGKDRLDAATLEASGEYYLQYFGPHRFAYRVFDLPEGKYAVDIIDTWNMTVTPLDGLFEGRFRIDLPAELYYAVRIRRV